jgi:predicted TIM-barrel fold metal-dependent hydrolase
VYEPQELWDRYVPEHYQAAARAALWHGFDEHGARLTIRNGEPVNELDRSRLIRSAIWRPGMTPDDIGALDPNAPVAPNPGAWDADVRLADMDTLGIDHAVLFPTVFAEHFPMIRNPDVAAVLARAYNDWVLAHASRAPDRLHPVAVLPLQSLMHARQELARVAELGFGAVFIRPMFHDVKTVETAGRGRPRSDGFLYQGLRSPQGVFVNDRHFRPLWEEIAERDLVACVHPSTGVTNPEPASAGSFVERVAARMDIGHPVAEATACFQDNAIFLTAALFQGLLEDLPHLRLAICHSGASWLPLVVEKAETYLWLSIPSVFMPPERPVALEPDDVIARHPLLVSFDSWESSVGALADEFVHNAAWSSRYPNHDATAPAEAITMLRSHDVSDDDIARLMGLNAQELFRLSAPQTAEPAAR